MALTAAGMAIAAMFFPGAADFCLDGAIFLFGPGLNGLAKRRQGIMQAVFGGGSNLFMAFAAGGIGVWKSGISNNAPVSGLPIWIAWVTPVACLTPYFTMACF